VGTTSAAAGTGLEMVMAVLVVVAVMMVGGVVGGSS
jgi:hypothetical protein